ncbi:MAG: hypothetical protein N2Z74_08365, partial [Syntrophales bacterium]|nr:hypothetical protein [Syntrophales bacterium]
MHAFLLANPNVIQTVVTRIPTNQKPLICDHLRTAKRFPQKHRHALLERKKATQTVINQAEALSEGWAFSH